MAQLLQLQHHSSTSRIIPACMFNRKADVLAVAPCDNPYEKQKGRSAMATNISPEFLRYDKLQDLLKTSVTLSLSMKNALMLTTSLPHYFRNVRTPGLLPRTRPNALAALRRSAILTPLRYQHTLFGCLHGFIGIHRTDGIRTNSDKWDPSRLAATTRFLILSGVFVDISTSFTSFAVLLLPHKRCSGH